MLNDYRVSDVICVIISSAKNCWHKITCIDLPSCVTHVGFNNFMFYENGTVWITVQYLLFCFYFGRRKIELIELWHYIHSRNIRLRWPQQLN